MTKIIDFPTSVKFADLCAFADLVHKEPRTESIHFRASNTKIFTPTSMSFIAKTCNSRHRRYGEKISYIGLEKATYANNLGFSDSLNLENRPFPQGAFGGSTYVPLSAMKRDQLEATRLELQLELGDVIELESAKVAKVVSQRRSEKLEKILSASFCEVFRNVFEHSDSDSATFCAQYWPSREVVEICISDRGIGFATSLAEDRKIGELTDRSALLYSLMPGVSSKARRNKKKRPEHRSVWDNAGIGLFLSHQLFGHFGEFAIASGTHGISIQSGKLTGSFPTSVEGSIISMRLKLGDIDELERYVDKVKKLAVEVKAKYGVNGLTLASIEKFLRDGE